jgi:integrase
MMELQPRLIRPEPSVSGLASGKAPFSREAEREIHLYAVRLLEDADVSVATVDNRIRRLRRLLRASVRSGGPDTLMALSRLPERVAGLLTEAGWVPTSQTAEMWDAYSDFIKRSIDQAEAECRIDEIGRLLLPRVERRWYLSDRVPGGHTTPTEGRRQLLFAVDLLAIREAAGRRKAGDHGVRDRALAGLCCWSGLRWEEIVSLSWEEITWERHPEGKLFPVAVSCSRRGEQLELPVHANAAPDLAELYRRTRRSLDRVPEGPVFRQLRFPGDRLSVREAQDILTRAGVEAGCGRVSLVDLRAAFAFHLMTTHDVTILELTTILGYGKHKQSRTLVRHHQAWKLNQSVDAAEFGGSHD